MTEKVALALGANLGDRLASLRSAVAALAPHVKIEAISPVYETAAAYVTDQPAFLNAALIGTTALEPFALLRALKDAEIELGRRPTFRYGPRAIDIDILLYGDRVVELPELHIPHKRMHERDFVLRPLVDIAPDWRHPLNGLSVSAMLGQITSTAPQSRGALLG